MVQKENLRTNYYLSDSLLLVTVKSATHTQLNLPLSGNLVIYSTVVSRYHSDSLQSDHLRRRLLSPTPHSRTPTVKMILVLVSSLFISSRAHVGAEDEDVASPVLTTDSTAVLCRTYSGNGGSCCSQESRQPLFGSHLCPTSKSVQLKSARPLQLRNKTIPLLANCVFPCRVADPHYEHN